MSALTYEDNGTDAIAKIIDEKEEKLVFLTEGDDAVGPEVDPMNDVFDDENVDLITQMLRDGMTLNEVVSILKGGIEDDQPDNEGKNIQLPRGSFINIYPASKSERIMIGGPAGQGKSTQAANYARLWKAEHPEQMIHLFARQEDDPAFDGIELEEIVIDDASILDEDLNLDDFANSLVIFDDMDNLQDKKVSEYILKLMGDLMANGRKKNIWIIYMTHVLLDRNKTKIALNESGRVIFFNGCGSRQNENFLKTYCGMKTAEVNTLCTLPSRWVCISRNTPRYVVHEKGIFLL